MEKQTQWSATGWMVPPDRLPVQGVGSQEGSCPTTTKPLHEPTLPLHTTISFSGTKPLCAQVSHKGLFTPLQPFCAHAPPFPLSQEGRGNSNGSRLRGRDIWPLSGFKKDFSDLFCPSSVSLMTAPQEADPEMRSPAPVPLTLPSLETSAF